MKEIFDEYVEVSFGELRQDEKKIRQFEHNYRRYFPANPEARVIDIGIGRGEMLTCMKRWGYQNALGLDISPSTVNFCKSLSLPCELIPDAASWLSNNVASCSVITLLDVLEHFPKSDCIDFLRRIRASLIPGGVVLIQVPNMQALHAALHRYQDFTHEIGFSEHSLKQVLSASGFKSFHFRGFENQIGCPLVNLPRRGLRSLLWSATRLSRKITGTLNPQVLHPVMFAVAQA